MKYIIIKKEIVSSVYDSMEDAIMSTFGEKIEEISDEELNSLQRKWRNGELVSTDYIVPLTDHPDHAATLAYRVALRDWPSTSDFPDTKPTI
jgi:hypothetical protein